MSRRPAVRPICLVLDPARGRRLRAHVRVIKANGAVINKTITAKTADARAKKIDALEDAGNLHEVVGFRDPKED